MFDVLRIAAVAGVLTLSVMQWFGLTPRQSGGALLPTATFVTAAVTVILGVFGTLIEMVFVNARTKEAKGIDTTAAPVREFGYRWQRTGAGVVFAFATLLMLPLLAGWPLMLAAGIKDATHPAIVAFFGFVFAVGVVLFVVGWRAWHARVRVYPDRLAVRGVYSNGSLRWDEARAFTHVEVWAGGERTMWVYLLSGDARNVRVEATVESPEEFVREVESRTGLTLEEHARDGKPKEEPGRRTHPAFSR